MVDWIPVVVVVVVSGDEWGLGTAAQVHVFFATH
jgi:hypothetical protein